MMDFNIDKEAQTALIKCTAIVCIAAIVIYSVSQGQDGLLIGGGSAAIAGLAGYSVGKKR
jgi:hypothetical protein